MNDFADIIADGRARTAPGYWSAYDGRRGWVTELVDAVEALAMDLDNARNHQVTLDQLEALAAERDALRAQLDGMTIERPYVRYPEPVRQRLVGPWVVVTE